MTKREDTIQMSVGGLTLDPVTKTPIVILKDTENKLNLPIWIGLLEATAMATEIEGIKMARPMVSDLLKDILGEVGVFSRFRGNYRVEGEYLLRSGSHRISAVESWLLTRGRAMPLL